MRFVVILAFLTLVSCTIKEQKEFLKVIDLNSAWQFRQYDSEDWLEAKIPGSVQQDLIRHSLLENPLVDTNEFVNRWVEGKEWEYMRHIPLTEIPKKENITLLFNGLDTYASIFLNDSLLFNANNMFRSWEVNLRYVDFKERNVLRIVFHSTIEEAKKAETALGYQLPSPNDAGEHKVSAFVRKAAYQFGWDWAPRVLTSGIWKGIELYAWDNYLLKDCRIIQDSIVDGVAFGRAVYTIESEAETKVQLNLESNGIAINEDVNLQQGTNVFTLPFKLSNLKLWWPNDWGEQYMYEFKMYVGEQSMVKKIGFRTIELIQEKDSIGRSFEFIVNGEALFIKGANYIPQSIFPSEIDTASYLSLLHDAAFSHFNMLRVWGGGIYEHDLFYDLCDSLGILVWQDFMFAGAMYPNNEGFINNVTQEAKEQVERISQHPCLAIWCGNNEVDVAWEFWGWQDEFGYDSIHKEQLVDGYDKIFKEKLPSTVIEFSPFTHYIHSSPLSNWGKEENFNYQNMHYWGVWHGTDDFDGFEKYVPRFMTEYGFQSFPSAHSFKNQVKPENLSLDNPILSNRQKSYKTNKELLRHLEQHYPLAEDYDSFSYLSQLNQRLAMRMAIDAHRKDRERCSGTLYWQLNDVWAGATWSTIEANGNWKAAQYMVRERYEPVIILPELAADEFQVYMSSHRVHETHTRLDLEALDFNGNTFVSHQLFYTIKANESELIERWDINDLIPSSLSNKQVLIHLKLFADDELLDEINFYLVEPKELDLENIEPEIIIKVDENKTLVEIGSTVLLKDVFLDFGVEGKWSQNFVDVLPNENEVFEFVPKSGSVRKEDLKITSLNSLIKID